MVPPAVRPSTISASFGCFRISSRALDFGGSFASVAMKAEVSSSRRRSQKTTTASAAPTKNGMRQPQAARSASAMVFCRTISSSRASSSASAQASTSLKVSMKIELDWPGANTCQASSAVKLRMGAITRTRHCAMCQSAVCAERRAREDEIRRAKEAEEAKIRAAEDKIRREQEEKERVDAPREHPRQAFEAQGSNNTKHNNQTVHRRLRRTIVMVTDDGQQRWGRKMGRTGAISSRKQCKS